MKVEKKEIDSLTAELTLVIEKDDYLPEYKEKLKSYQAKAHMKGFRKGKTPQALIKKMYGTATMQESVSKLLGEKINEIISGDEYNIIGEPLFIEDGEVPLIDHTDPQDYSYRFEIGLEPDFDVIGISESDTYDKFDIEVSDEMMQEEIENISKKMGKQDAIETLIEAEDVVYLSLNELKDGEQFEGGHSTDFSINADKITDTYKSTFLKLKKGDKIKVDVYDLEADMTKDSVEKYFLKIENKEGEEPQEVGNMFEAEVTNVIRNVPAEFNQELFDKYFGEGEVKSEAEAKDKIKAYMTEYFGEESKKLLHREIMEALMVVNNFDLPEGFIKKWVNREKEMPEDQFGSFMKELKWRIIKKKLANRFEVKVEEQEILDYFVKAIRGYSPYIDEASLKNTAFSLMQNREQVNTAVETISSGKLFDAISEVIKTNSTSISKDDFYDKVKAINEKVK